MSTFVERNFRVKGTVDCFFTPPSGAAFRTLAGIEVQLWHQSPMVAVFLGKGVTNSSGEYVIDIAITSPTSYIFDGQIKNVFAKFFYNGEEIKSDYDIDALAYFEQLTPQPSLLYKIAINNLILKLKSDGNWDKLDRLWIFATEYQQHATVSLINPTSAQISEISSPSWTADQGYTGNGSSSYLKSNFIPSSDSVQGTQDSTSFGVYLRTNTGAANKIDFGTLDGTHCTSILAKWSDNHFYANVNDASASHVVTSTSSTGLSACSRTSSTNVNYYRNGVSLGSGTQVSNGLSTIQLYMCCWNSSGTAGYFSDRQISMAYYGAGDIDNLAFYEAFQAFAVARG